MPSLPGFINGSNTLASVIADAERSVLWFLEPISPGTGAPYLRPTPGIEPYVVLGSGPVRCQFTQDNRSFAVGGNGFYEIFPSHTYTRHGTVALDGRPATICSNGSAGNQLFIVSGGYGYTFDLSTDTLTQISDPDFPFPCTMGAFIDGYFLALKGSSNLFQWSALEDGTTWSGLDVAQLSQSSDYIVSLTAVHGQVWLLGSKTSVVWADTGGSSAFTPIPGSLGQQGSGAAFSAATIDNTILWLGGNDQGQAVVYRANGYTPQRVSTHAVETALQSYERVSDAIAWVAQMDGHSFYVLYLPKAPVQWAYDLATNQWFEWALWDTVNLVDIPHVMRTHTYAFGQHLVGDRQSGAIYRMGFDICPSTLVQMGAA